MNTRELFEKGCNEYGINMNEDIFSKFMKYKEILLEWNEKFNLTAIKDEQDIFIKHFLDSLSILKYIKEEDVELIDIGTGAGFPGIPVKIIRDNINVTLADSLAKRVNFLRNVISELHLKGINAVHGRAEDLAKDKDKREKYDYCTARAVASLPILLEYCLPFVKKGGYFIAMKSNVVEEVEISVNALKILGGEIMEVKEFQLPNSDSKRTLVIIKKIFNTPAKYPRKAGTPTKKPL